MDFQSFAAGFKTNGGCQVFGIPGGGPSLQLMDALERQGAQLVATGHESTAALMAGALGRFTRKPSLAVSIKGPGFINMAPGLLCNSYEGFPMLSVSEAYSLNDLSGRRHKWLNHLAVTGSYLRGMTGYEDTEDFFSRCWNLALTQMPGPVHVDLAEAPGLPIHEKANPSETVAESLLEKISRPILIVGSALLHNPIWRKKLSGLKVPVFTTVAAKGLVDECGPYAAGIYTGDGRELTPEKKILPHADKIFYLGVRAGEVLSPTPPGADNVFLDLPGLCFPPDSKKGGFLVSGESIGLFLDRLATFHWGDEIVREAVEKMDEALDGGTLQPAAYMQIAAQIVPDAVHVTDTGNFTVIAEHTLRARTEQDFLGTPNGRFMGAGLCYALGITLSQQKRPVLLWIGDGGLRSYFSELALAAEYPSNLCILVMEDGYYGSIMSRARQMGLTETPLTLKPRDYLRAAEAFGLDAIRVDSAESLGRALVAWKSHPERPLIVGCRFDPETYKQQALLLR